MAWCQEPLKWASLFIWANILVWRVPLVMVAVLGLVLPLMGLSLVAVLLWTMLFYLVYRQSGSFLAD